MQNSAIKNLILTSLLIVFIVSSGLSVYAQSPLTTKDLNVFSWRNIGPYTFSGRIGPSQNRNDYGVFPAGTDDGNLQLSTNGGNT